MKLINETTHKEIHPGDTATTFRGQQVKVISFAPPHKPSSTGRVYIENSNHQRGEYFPSVINAIFVGD